MVRISFFSVPIWEEEARWLELRAFILRQHSRTNWNLHRHALKFVIRNEMIYHFEWRDVMSAMTEVHFSTVAIVEYLLCFAREEDAALFRLFHPEYDLAVVVSPFD